MATSCALSVWGAAVGAVPRALPLLGGKQSSRRLATLARVARAAAPAAARASPAAAASSDAVKPSRRRHSGGPARTDRLLGFDKPSVWIEFTPLSLKYNSINMGQGFPNWAAPDFVKEAAARAITTDNNQYCRSQGLPALVEAVAEHSTPLHGRDIDPLTEVAVCVGATEALFGACQAFVEPGDEVVILEPAYDAYVPDVRIAGGTPVSVPLRPREGAQPAADGSRRVNDVYSLDLDELRAAFTPRTRAIMLNSPHNPTGKVFSREELEGIAGVLRDFPDVLVISDECYEYMAWKPHTRFATIDGMWDRTVTISSAGKTFSCTGWKIGYVVGPADLVRRIHMTNQWVQFCIATPLQAAVAEAMVRAREPYRGAESYFAWLATEYEAKCRLLCEGLSQAGLPPVVPDGGFFVMADIGGVEVPEQFLSQPSVACPDMTNDWAFARWMTIGAGVTPIPPSAFYSPQYAHLGAHHSRFAFCKTDKTIRSATSTLKTFFSGL